MNQNINSFGFDQIQPPQYPVIHHPPQEMSEKILQAKENLMKSIQTFLKKFNRISFREMPKVLSRTWENFFEIQHAQPEDTHELLRKLLEDLQIISEELAKYINSPSWNRPTFYDDDDEHSIEYKEYLENYSNAIAPVLPTEEPEYSLIMGDEYLSTILKTESDEDSYSQMEEIDLFLDTDDLMLPDIENDDYDSERDIHFLEELLSNDTHPFLENESSNFDHHDDPSFSRPPPKPPDVEIFFDFEFDTGVLIAKVVEDISEHHVLMPKVLPTIPTLYLEASRARCFVHRSLELQSLAYGNPISDILLI
nr:hypothetical protein [Tanacetum cinerariifolium]